MTNEELRKILENHKHWLNEDVDGWEEMRADFTGANLEGANLEGTCLVMAIFRDANLAGANLKDVDLGRAYLEGADLEGANLEGAYLAMAIFRDANLAGANLVHANLEAADLEGADLEGAYLEGAYLRRADFRCSNLKDVDLGRAYIVGAGFRNAKNVPFIPMTCPDEGAFIGWKKATFIDNKEVRWEAITKLYIPEDAKRSSAAGRKCRCDRAKVLDIELLATGEKVRAAYSHFDSTFVYKVGECVEVDNFDEDRFNECAPGIHFFINKQEAIDY